MIRSVLSTTGAALLLATSAYAQEPLRAAVDGTFAPHAFPNLSGGYQGFNVDLANEIAKRLKRKIVIDAAQFSGLVPALQAGTYDFLAAPTTVTKERAESMLFTEGYLNTDFQFLIKKGSPKVVRLEELKGKTISVNKGSAYDSWARDLEGAGGPSRARRRECRRQYRHRVGGQEQPTAGAVISAFDWSRLGCAAAQGLRRAAQGARRRRRMHET
jgi:ABC-type amino acid transport substrate-binding protein